MKILVVTAIVLSIQAVFAFALAEPTTKNMPKIKLTYFDIEGAAEPVRLALALAGQEYEDDRIAFGDWAALKPKMPNGQLPVMQIDGGKMKTQSGAMLRWVGKEFSKTLYPDDKLFEVEEAIGIVGDLQKAWQPAVYIGMRPQNFGYPEDFSQTDEGKEKIKMLRTKFVQEQMPNYLGLLEDMLKASGGKWLIAGTDEPTIADCMAVSFLRSFTKGHVDYVDPKCLEINPMVVAYVKRFCDLPQIKGRYNDGLGSAKY